MHNEHNFKNTANNNTPRINCRTKPENESKTKRL